MRLEKLMHRGKKIEWNWSKECEEQSTVNSVNHIRKLKIVSVSCKTYRDLFVFWKFLVPKTVGEWESRTYFLFPYSISLVWAMRHHLSLITPIVDNSKHGSSQEKKSLFHIQSDISSLGLGINLLSKIENSTIFLLIYGLIIRLRAEAHLPHYNFSHHKILFVFY